MKHNVLPVRLKNFLDELSLAQRSMMVSFVIIAAGVVGIGFWVGEQIEVGVVNRIGATAALYVDSVVSQQLQELSQSSTILPEHLQALDQLLHETALGQQIVVFKVWDKTGRVVYSTISDTVGQTFPIGERLQLSLDGTVVARISELDEDENLPEKKIWPQLLEIYMPVRLRGTDQVIAAVEFYQITDDLDREIKAAQMRSWLVIGGVMLVMYLLLAAFAKWASDTIARQQVALNAQVDNLILLLNQNKELDERVRRAAAKVAALNERILRRIGAELHDGPAQDMSLAALRLGHVIGRKTQEEVTAEEQLTGVQKLLQHAIKDIRGIASGLSLPQLQELSLAETIVRAVRNHERRSGTKVTLIMDDPPEQAGTLPLKITVYRLIQEALNNAFRHAGGVGQQVEVSVTNPYLNVEVSDQGPGFDIKNVVHEEMHLGVEGMQERVESLGGQFRILSGTGQGTKVQVRLSLDGVEGIEYE